MFSDVIARKIWPVSKWVLYIFTVPELTGACVILWRVLKSRSR